jgi:hypothetical protein
MPTFEQMLEKGAFELGFGQGVERGERALLLCLLVRRFGEEALSHTHQVTRATTGEIVRWFERAVDAATLDEVFASPHHAATLGDMFASPPPALSPGASDQPSLGPKVVKYVVQDGMTLDELLARGDYVEGIQEGMRALVLHQLVHRFGALPESVTRRVTKARTAKLKRWGERILDAASLDDVFATF